MRMPTPSWTAADTVGPGPEAVYTSWPRGPPAAGRTFDERAARYRHRPLRGGTRPGRARRFALTMRRSAPFGGGPPSRAVDPPGDGPCAGTRLPREDPCHVNRAPRRWRLICTRPLDSSAFLFGDRLTETDVRLFVTLVRFDAAYHGLFKCNLRRMSDYPNLSAHLERMLPFPASPAR